MPFPKDFLWGCATSAGQIEGGAFEDGRTASIWDTFAAKPGKTFGGETPTVACDSYHKFDRDLRNMKALGLNAYRMSISWSRVLPDGTVRPVYLYAVDAAEFVVNKLLDRGSLSATTMVTNVQDFIGKVAAGLGVI